MNNIRYFLSSLLIIIILITGTIIFETKTNYEGADERQKFETLKSCTLGFIILLILNAFSFITIISFELPFHPEILITLSMIIAVTAAFFREIWKNNMYSKTISSKWSIVIFSLIIFAGVFRCYSAYMKSKAIENLIFAIALASSYGVCMISALVRMILNKKSLSEAE